MYAFSVPRARAWMWALVVVAVLSMSVLLRAITSPPGAWPALSLLASGTLLVGSAVQAARLHLALTGASTTPRTPLRDRLSAGGADRQPDTTSRQPTTSWKR